LPADPLTDAPIAVIADIHGNADALEAVLADAARAGARRVLALGDHLSSPLAAGETAAMLRAVPGLVAIRGNHDRILVEERPEAMGGWDRPAFDQLQAGDLDWLGAMPATLEWEQMFLCHGTPASDSVFLLEEPSPPDGRLVLAGVERIEAAVQGVRQPVILCAHSHVARTLRLADGRLVVNPGSVGCPAWHDPRAPGQLMETGSPDAAYALLSRGPAGWQARLCHVPYDPGRMIALARAAGHPAWERALRTGRVR
jgi:predicted phosphodiesterase